MELWTVFLRTILIYFVVLIMMKITEKKEPRKLTSIDLIYYIMIAEFAVMLIYDIRISLVYGFIPLGTLLSLRIITAYFAYRREKIRRVTEKSSFSTNKPDQPELVFPLPLIIEGKVLDNNLQQIQKTRFWLKNEVQKFGIKKFKNVAFCGVNQKGSLLMDKKKI